MSFRIFPAILFLAFLFFSCGTSKVITTSPKTEAEKFEEAQNFQQATNSWKTYFEQTPVEQTEGADFARAAQSAYKSDNTALALGWFDQARYKNYSDFEMYLTLAEIYGKQKNISKELSALEYISENFPDKSGRINNRLFQIYNEIKLTDNALLVWNELDETSKSDLTNLTSYFLIHKELKDSTVCDSLAPVILEKNSQQLDALEWMASKYYWMGENRYQLEMGKYNANKTNRQYKLLLKELDKSTADFKKSLSYFEKLWDIEPGEKYASYFANIYARFGDEKKAKFYQKYIDN